MERRSFLKGMAASSTLLMLPGLQPVDPELEPGMARAQVELIWRRCAEDPHFFFEHYWKILHPQGSRLFELRDPQAEVLDIWMSGDNHMTLKARQIGWSTLIAAFAFHKGFFNEESNILLLSKGEREAKKLLAKCKYGYQRLPQWMKDRGPTLRDNSTQVMSFDNDSAIESLPSTAGRGEAATLTVVDEFAFLTNPEDTWAAVEPTADIGGQILLLSTANGIGNLFQKMWSQIQMGMLASWRSSFYGWWAVPERDEVWYEAKKRDLEPWQLAQEYPDNPEEAFIKSGRLVFDYDRLRAMPVQQPIMRCDVIDGELYESDDGMVEIYAMPELSKRYSAGVDTAEGLEHGDFSDITVVDNEGTQVCQFHEHMEPDQLALYVDAIGRFYGNALVVVEANNHGLVTLTTLRHLNYPNLFRREARPDEPMGARGNYGFFTTTRTKPMLIDALRMDIREEDVTVVSNLTNEELKGYVFGNNGTMSGSPFDDAVMGLAFANWGRQFLYMPEYEPERAVERYSGDWWEAQMAKARQPATAGRIGRNNVRPQRP